MKHPLDQLIEERIREALEQGDLSNLPGEGSPIPNLDLPPEDVLTRAIREQGGKPAFVVTNAKLRALIKQLGLVKDPLRRKALEDHIAAMRTRMAIEREQQL